MFTTVTKSMIYLNKLLCFEPSSFVRKVEWIKPFKQRMVQSKVNICASTYSTS